MKKSIIALSILLALTACGKKEEFAGMQHEQSQSQSAPVTQSPVQQAPVAQQQDSGFGWGSAAIGAAAGYMLGSSGSNRPTERVIERQTVSPVAPSRQVPVYTPQPNRQITPSRVAPVVPSTPKPPVVVAAPVAPKPVAPAVQPSKPSYSSGFSGYSSVRQSAPTYRSSPSFNSGRRR